MSELIDREALKDAVKRYAGEPIKAKDKKCQAICLDMIGTIDSQPTVNPWHRVEDDPPDKKTYAIFYYEWTGISGTVYRETSIISLNELMALGCRPIAWMEKPKPPEEGV